MNEEHQLYNKIKKPNVILNICYSHSVNCEEPIICEETVKGSFVEFSKNAYLIKFSSSITGEKLFHSIKLVQENVMYWEISSENGNLSHDLHFETSKCTCADTYINKEKIAFANKTRRLDYYFEEKEGFVDIFYEKYSNSLHLGYYNIEINISPT
jgi:uncharacterized beta-barrel protein YwiB (DUF1934 family)